MLFNNIIIVIFFIITMTASFFFCLIIRDFDVANISCASSFVTQGKWEKKSKELQAEYKEKLKTYLVI